MSSKTQIDLTETNYLVATALGNVLADFLIDRDVSGVRPATLSFYSRELKPFIRWAGETGARTLEDITPDYLRAYFMSLRKRRNKNGIHKNYTVVRTWLRWAWVEYDLPTACPITKVRIASPESKQQPAISLEDFKKLLNSIKGRNIKRDRAILLVLLDTGIRRFEMCRLQVSSLRENGIVQLEANNTKTGSARKVFLNRKTQRALKAYLAERGKLRAESPLFATEKGEMITPSVLRQIIRRRCNNANIPEKGMHAFRRGFALEIWRSSHDLEAVSRLLGHAKVTTTRLYLPLDDDDLREVHARHSPINRLRERK